jgi:hypothetical protein
MREAFPCGVAFWLEVPLLLLCGLLRGRLFSCFLGCHLPILPFNDFSIVSAIVIAVEECIDSCTTSVKEKTKAWWKNRQQFFECGIVRRLYRFGSGGSS